MAGIEAEHCDMYGADKLLRAAPCDTTPRAEFEYVMGRRECPPQNLLNSRGEPTRRIRPIDELLQDRLSVKAGLRREEIVALVRFSTVSTHEFRYLFLALSLFLRSLLPRPLPFLSLYLYLYFCLCRSEIGCLALPPTRPLPLPVPLPLRPPLRLRLPLSGSAGGQAVRLLC